jgi:hypothetical protein
VVALAIISLGDKKWGFNMMKKMICLILTSLLLTASAFAGTVDLPQTGQKKCYDTSGNEISCTGTGQDG